MFELRSRFQPHIDMLKDVIGQTLTDSKKIKER